MQGQDFLVVAKNLIKSQFEASIRTAISRAYYAVLNSANELLLDLGFSVERGPGVHGQVRNRLANCGVETLADFQAIFDELRAQRNDADYNMKSKEFHDQTICALRVARAALAINLLADCNKEPLRSQIRKGIHDYEKQISS